ALDVLLHFPAEVTLDGELVDLDAEAVDLIVGQAADPGVRIQAGRRDDLLRGRLADAVDVGECDLQPLFAGNVDTGNASHRCSCSSALALLVTGVFADHHDATVPANDLALLADFLDTRSDLHGWPLLVAVRDSTPGEVVGSELYLNL